MVVAALLVIPCVRCAYSAPAGLLSAGCSSAFLFAFCPLWGLAERRSFFGFVLIVRFDSAFDFGPDCASHPKDHEDPGSFTETAIPHPNARKTL